MLRSMLMEPVYRAKATLQIERANPNVLPFQRLTTDEGAMFYGFYETQYGLITSRRVAREVIRSLGLDKHPEFAMTAPSSVDPGLTAEEVIEGARISKFLVALEVAPVSKSRLVDLSFKSTDRVLAARAANAVAETYMALNTQAGYNTTEQASTSLAGEVETLQREIEEKEKRLQAYAAEHGIIPINETQDITLKNLTDLSKAHTEAQAVRIEKESRFEALGQAAPADVDEVAGSRIIGELSAKKDDLAKRLAQLSEMYGPAWPEISRVQGEIQETERRLERERTAVFRQVLGAAEADYRAARMEEESLAREIEELKGRNQALSLKEIEYRTLKSEIENRRKTLEAIQRRQGEARSSAGLNDLASSNVRIVDRAEVPLGASEPKLWKNFILSLVGGLGLGLALVFFFEYLDKSVKTEEDLETATGVPALGIIPASKADGARLRLVKAANGGSDEARAGGVGMIAHENPQSKVSESVREMRTTLLVSRPGGPPRTILVTSSQQEEGKTSVASNLAITLAQMGRRVLLVDADMRRPRQHLVFGLPNDAGLSSALSGDGTEALTVCPTPVAGLDVMTSGPIPPNPADLLNSEAFESVLGKLSTAGFDHIIFDSPPVLAVADPCIIAGKMDSVVIVAWAGVTGRDALAHTVGRLRQVKARITGAVLNKADHGHLYYGRYGSYRSTGGYKPEASDEDAGRPGQPGASGVVG
jgi:capsular exopolysaccharide synthesis family protein